jgi:hypothetical protein
MGSERALRSGRHSSMFFQLRIRGISSMPSRCAGAKTGSDFPYVSDREPRVGYRFSFLSSPGGSGPPPRRRTE